MDLPKSGDATSRFLAFVEGLTSVIGHADRAKPLRDYCIGLMMPGERKSVEPMAAITAPERTAAQHQSLLHFVGEGTWSDEKVLAKVREMVLPEIERHGPIEAWIIDDTGFPKKGRHSVGVGRQYCGELGKQDNCQIAVTLSIANHHASLPAAYRLYLPKAAGDLQSCCGVTASTNRSRSRSLRLACRQRHGARSRGGKPRRSRCRHALPACAFVRRIELGHFEGRGWRGFHHHATLCIAAYGFLISERETIPPSGTRSTKLFKEITIPEAYRPRGSAIAA